MDNKPNNNKQNNKKSQTFMVLIIAVVLTLVIISLMSRVYRDATTTEITYTEFLNMLEDGEVSKVTFAANGKIVITPLQSNQTTDLSGATITTTYWTANLYDDNLLAKIDEINSESSDLNKVEYGGEWENTESSILDFFMYYILPFLIIYLLMYFVFRRVGGGSGGGGIMGVGRSNAKVYVQKETGVTFKDVAGQNEAKESLTEIVDFLHNPQKYADVGAKLPKGALLVGPPGTGKTLLAKAVAGEAKVPFFSLSGSDFVEMFVGVGASRVRDLFKQAQAQAPCIIFIDEVDAIGKSRDSKYGGGNDEREQTLNQLLAEMDGFDTSKGLFILAATNRPEVLDKALLRPGRFDRRIIVDKPDLKGRIDTLKVHSTNVAMDETVDLEEIALATSGAVGSDLANMINEAAINAVKNGRKAISQSDLFESVEVVIAGKEKKDRIMNESGEKNSCIS